MSTSFLQHAPGAERHLASLLARLLGAEEPAPELAAGLSLLGLLRERGDLCVELDRFCGRPLPLEEADPELVVPERARMESVLRELACVSDGSSVAPLVLRDGRLYLWRSFAGEQQLARRLLGMLAAEPKVGAPELPPLERSSDDEVDWQQVAILSALRHRLCVITGGPGTGKTTTVLHILSALVSQDPGLDIALAAPTGKAATRLSESLRGRRDSLPEDIRERIPSEVQTLHGLLGYRPLRSEFRHDEDRVLPWRVIVVDEVSMVPLALMSALVRALRADARLILLGDADQLASVGAGAVLRELCVSTDPEAGHGAAFAAEFESWTGKKLDVQEQRGPLGDACVRLRKSHRFDPNSGIGLLAASIRRGDADQALELLTDEKETDLRLLAPEALRGGEFEELAAHFATVRRAEDATEALARLPERQVLCALRRGPEGAEGWNHRIEQALARQGVDTSEPFYRGRPVLVTRNDRATSLSNGDVGVIWPGAQGADACFPSEPRLLRVPVARLPEHATSYAMTIHKSQGSEYPEVWIVLPRGQHPILCAELLYTAVTRARARVTVVAEEAALRFAMGRRTERASTLADALRAGV